MRIGCGLSQLTSQTSDCGSKTLSAIRIWLKTLCIPWNANEIQPGL